MSRMYYALFAVVDLYEFVVQREAETYSWVPNRQVYSFIWHQRSMKKETDTKTDKSI